MKSYAFGVDIGGTAIKLGLFRVDGALLKKWQIPTCTQDKGTHVLPDVLDAVRGCMNKNGINWSDVEGVGMGVPGPVGDDGTVFGCVNLGWNMFNVPEKLLQLESGLRKAQVSNDVNAATLGELWKGGAQGHRSAFMVTLGTGIGGGLIINNEIINGVGGGAGEIGHFCVEPQESERCKCGEHGCLEQYCSATGLLRQAKKALAENTNTISVLKSNDALTAKDVCDAAKQGDTLALALLDRLGHRLGWALTAVAGTADPEVFVIGGGLSNAGEILLDKIKFYYRKYAFHAFRNTPFVLAKLGNDAGIYGCAKMIL